MTELVGRIELAVTGRGSKSEMTTTVLVPEEPHGEQVVLRRRGARALSAEPALAAYAGQRVRVVGEQTWTTFVVDAITAEEPGEG